MEAWTLTPGTRQEGEVTREPISSGKVGRGNWPSPRDSLTLLHRPPPSREGFLLKRGSAKAIEHRPPGSPRRGGGRDGGG